MNCRSGFSPTKGDCPLGTVWRSLSVKWLEIAVSAPVDGIEQVSEIFIEMGTGGVVIEDPALILAYAREIHPDEWAVPAQPASDGLALIKAYLPLQDGWQTRLEKLKNAVNRLNLTSGSEITRRVVRDEDWAGAWKKYYRTLRVGRRLVVKPSWENYQPLADDLIIEMDPGMAFGSGTHSTTALCLRFLEKYVSPGMSVYDIGTGSGILAIAASRLGAAEVQALDVDPLACGVAAKNVANNNAGEVIKVRQGRLEDLPKGGADLVVANIIADVIAGLAPHTALVLKPGGIFIASGIIRERAEMVRRALAAADLTICEEQADGLWIAIAAVKKAGNY